VHFKALLVIEMILKFKAERLTGGSGDVMSSFHRFFSGDTLVN
jgi:hypothetical protein